MDLLDHIRASGIVKGITAIIPLTEGSFSDCFLIRTEKESFVLKIRKDESHRLEREFKLLSNPDLVRTGIAPKVFAFDKSCSKLPFPFLLEEYVKGQHPVLSDAFILAMAETYRRLHAITSKVTEEGDVKRINSLLLWSEELSIKLEKRDVQDPALQGLFTRLREVCSQHDTLLGRDLYNFVQCDPSPENIFVSDTVRLIDWDFAGFHLFERDLVLFCDCYDLTQQQERVFLVQYGVDPDQIATRLSILRLLLWCGDILWLLKQDPIKQERVQRIVQKCESMSALL